MSPNFGPLLTPITNSVSALLRLSVTRPKAVLTAIGLLSVLAALQLPSVELQLDGRSLIPKDHPALRASDTATERFGLRDSIIIAIHREDGIFHPTVLAGIQKLTRAVAEVEGVAPDSVVSLATVPRLLTEDGVLDLRPLLARGEPDARLAARLNHEVMRLGWNNDVLVSKDGSTTALYAEVVRGADLGLIRDRISQLATELQGNGVALYFSGTALAQAELGEAASIDLARLVPFVLGVMALVLGFLFRSLVAVLATLAEVGVSLIWTVGLLGWTDHSVFVTTLALPVILIVIGVSDDIYALNSYFMAAKRDKGSRRELAYRSLAAVSNPIILTALTTIVALLCLTLTELQPQRTFGLFGAAAVASSTLLTFSLVPAVLTLWPPRARRGGPAALLAPLLGAHRRLPATRLIGAALGVVFLSTLAALITLPRLRVDDNWVRNLPPTSPVAAGDRAINRLLAGTDTLELELDSGRRDGFVDPASFLALGFLEDELLANPAVGAVVSPYNQVLRLLAALSERPVAEYRSDLNRHRIELSAAEIEQALTSLDSLVRSPVRGHLDRERRRARVTVFVHSADYSTTRAVFSAAQEAWLTGSGSQEIVPFGDAWIGYTTIQLLVEGQIRSILAALLSDTVLLTALFGSPATALIAVIPVALAVLLVAGVLALSGTPIGTANSMFAAIAFGVGVDYSIHLVAYQSELLGQKGWRKAMDAAVEKTGPAIVLSAVAIAAGFSVLGLSQVMPNRQLGLLVALAMPLCAFLTLVVVPGLSLLRRSGGAAIISCLLVLGQAAPANAEPAEMDPLASYNARELGQAGFRRIELELWNGGLVTRKFRTIQAWQQSGKVVRSVVLVEEPEGMRGTCYLLVEDPELPMGFEVFLHIAAGKRRVLALQSGRYDEGLLGSDFGYADLLWRLSTRGRSAKAAGGSTVDLEAVDPLVTENSAWQRIRYRFDGSPALLRAADYFDDRVAEPAKHLSVEGWRQQGEVWTPTRMVMTRTDDRRSVLTLVDARFDLTGFAPGAFQPEALPGHARELESGVLPTFIREQIE